MRAIVVLPARNEASNLPASLAALAAQVDADGTPLDGSLFEVLLLANNCDDGSAAIARHFAATRPRLRLHVVEVSLPPPQANIGYVRRQLMDQAASRLESIGRPDAAIVSSDADTCVAPDWLAATWRELDKGIDAVGGRILIDATERPLAAALRLRRIDTAHALLRSRLASLLDPQAFDPWPRHHQHFGASLAVTARAYRKAGGMPEVPYLEDEALVRALERADLRVRRSPEVRVVTSSRLDGRASVGLSWQLRQWTDAVTSPHDPLVEDPRRYAQALSARAVLRQAWQRHGASLAAYLPASLEANLAVPPGSVAHAALSAQTFGALWQSLDADRLATSSTGDAPAQVAVSQALPALRSLIQRHRQARDQGASKTSMR